MDLPPPTEETYYVLELSSYQLTLLETAVLECAVLLNMTPDHLAYHGSMDRYVAAKIHIFDLVKKGAVCLSGADDAVTQELL